MKKRIIVSVWCMFIGLILFVALIGVAMWNGMLGGMPDLEELQNPIDKYASQVYSADGKLMGTWNRAGANRIAVDYDQLPKALVNGLVATEDERFFEHSGVDVIALSRAVVKRLIMGDKSAGGGSTITQQLAKQLFSEQSHNTFQRALRKPFEWIIAIKLEKLYTKEEIIAMYLNYFDFLHNANGIKNASDVYFSKQPLALSVEECATLVGMCKNPSYFNPVRYNERTRQRRNVVLGQMAKNGYITKAESERLSAKPLVLNYHTVDYRDGMGVYMREYLRQIMMAEKPNKDDYPSWNKNKYYEDSLAWEEDALYGWCNKNLKKDGSSYDIYTDGLKIYTTLDSRMQRYAEEACYRHVATYLQPLFDEAKGVRANFPYSGNITTKQFENIMKRSMRQSERYRSLKEKGMDEDEIFDTFKRPVPMTLFSYKGEKEVTMTPYDSILYYKSFLRCGFMCMDAHTGAVKAYVGGLNYEYFSYDMAMEGKRQVGSTIKPFLYSLALENGWVPCDMVPTYRQTYYVGGKAYTPRGTSHGGSMSLRSALAWSNNHASVYLISKLHPGQFIDMLHKYGIRNKTLYPSLSLSLGSCDVNVGEMVSGYTAFVNHGIRSAPLLVTKIVDRNGNVVATFRPRQSDVISEASSFRMIDMLRAVVDQGSGRRIRGLNITCDMGGKTGTTNSHSDAWFIGCTPQLVAGEWVGGEDRDIHFNSMYLGQGSHAALPIWAYFMEKVLKDATLPYDADAKFDIPEDFDMCSKASPTETDGTGIDEIFE